MSNIESISNRQVFETAAAADHTSNSTVTNLCTWRCGNIPSVTEEQVLETAAAADHTSNSTVTNLCTWRCS